MESTSALWVLGLVAVTVADTLCFEHSLGGCSTRIERETPTRAGTGVSLLILCGATDDGCENRTATGVKGNNCFQNVVKKKRFMKPKEDEPTAVE
jgi:hypothetical protein